MALMLLLFKSTIIRGEYDEVAVWLLTSRNVINSSLRDLFSSSIYKRLVYGFHVVALLQLFFLNREDSLACRAAVQGWQEA